MSMLARTVTLERAPKRRRTAASTKLTKVGRSRRNGNQTRGKRQSMFFDPFPSQLRTKMRYTETILINIPGNSTSAVFNYFSCNGIHDPNITGTGHQPYGHDQVAALYNHYKVERSRIVVTPSAATDNLIFGVHIGDDTVDPGALGDAVLERKRTVYSTMRGGGVNPGMVSTSWSPRMAFPAGAEGKNLNASYGSNPGEQMLFGVFAKRMTLTGAFNIVLNVQIEYDVLSYEMKDLAQS